MHRQIWPTHVLCVWCVLVSAAMRLVLVGCITNALSQEAGWHALWRTGEATAAEPRVSSLARRPTFEKNSNLSQAAKRKIVEQWELARAGRPPPTTSWQAVCPNVKHMASSHLAASAEATWRIKALQSAVEAQTGSSKSLVRRMRRAKAALAETAKALSVDLSERGVLCGSGNLACTVTASMPNITICLPPVAGVISSVVCEPYGERWQQYGGPLGGFSDTGCAVFDAFAIARWLDALRADTPFLQSASDSRLPRLLSTKPRRMRQVATIAEAEAIRVRLQRLRGPSAPIRVRRSSVEDEVWHLEQLINETLPPARRKLQGLWAGAGAGEGAGARAGTGPGAARRTKPGGPPRGRGQLGGRGRAGWRPGMFEACSVVGAGHDLMCGAMKGDEIDSATAVFRANAAQASEISNPVSAAIARLHAMGEAASCYRLIL